MNYLVYMYLTPKNYKLYKKITARDILKDVLAEGFELILSICKAVSVERSFSIRKKFLTITRSNQSEYNLPSLSLISIKKSNVKFENSHKVSIMLNLVSMNFAKRSEQLEI